MNFVKIHLVAIRFFLMLDERNENFEKCGCA